MKRSVLLLIAVFACTFSKASDAGKKNDLYLTENKGQVSDQFHKPRPDILFSASDGQLTFHLKKNGISYQQYRVDNWMEAVDPRNGKKEKVANETSIYRVDIHWPGCNPDFNIEYGAQLEGYSNFYNDVCPNGVHNVLSYYELTYKNIYNGINLKWYQKNGHLKYDYIVSPGADYKLIQLQINGAEKLSISKNGELIIKTPLGEIVEEAPYVTQNGKAVKAYWKLIKNVATFTIPSYDPALPLLIDPGVRMWGTYYGGSNDDIGSGISTDNNGNVYLAGYTDSNNGTSIATAGSHQTTYGGGVNNGYLAKFKNTGVRLWATYYGGAVREIGFNCSVDPAGNVFLCGHSITPTPNVIATPGAHQTVHGGNWDAFLVKFNSAGVRQWGTYYGNNQIDFGYCCTTDIFGNSYLTGKTSVPNGTIIATPPNAHQGQYGGSEDAFLVKFNANGVRVWGTYFGGEGADVGYGLDTDNQGNIYLVGHTSSTANIATPGSHQSSQGNAGSGWDAFVAKFNNNGILQWGSYYGGTGNDVGYGCAVTQDGSAIYLSGKTDSNNGNSIAIDGSHQSAFAGGTNDAFLVKFNALGQREWGTYYGGNGDDVGYSCAVNVLGYPYLAGYTGSSSGTAIATPGSHQPTFGGLPFDGFIVLFDEFGVRQYGTYYGGSNTEIGNFVATDNAYNVYFTGVTDSFTTPDISTSNGHQQNYGFGFSDAFFVRFYDCTPPLPPLTQSNPANQSICTGNTTTLQASGTGSVSWYTTPTSGSPIQSGTVLVTPVLSTGTYTYYASAATCSANPVRTPITVTVHPLPILFVSSSESVICAGQTATLSSAGVSSYTWSTGSNGSSTVVSPTVTTTYTVSGTSPAGCVGSVVITQSVAVCPGFEEFNSIMNQLLVYPNPVTDFVMISNLSEPLEFELYNVLGEKITSGTTKGNSCKINLEEFSDGIYVIYLSSTSEKRSIKIIKK